VERVASVAARAVADGADSASFGDTTGMATPCRVQALVGTFRSQHPEMALNLHFHNTRGAGLANVLAALDMGVADFDASVGGLGGCPYAPGATGNIATEELVHMVEDMGVATRGSRAADRRGRRGGADRRAQAAVPGAARRAADTDGPAVERREALRVARAAGRRPGAVWRSFRVSLSGERARQPCGRDHGYRAGRGRMAEPVAGVRDGSWDWDRAVSEAT
jgi:hypothetical protein